MGQTIQYLFIVRLTFATVLAVLITLFHLGVTLFFPTFTHLFFSLLGCIVLPCIVAFLSFYLAQMTVYTSHIKRSPQEILQSVWIPPVGVFFVNVLILPLEMMSDSVGPLQILAATSIASGFLVTFFLQLYVGWRLQEAFSEPTLDISGASAPIKI
jgi:hypothetical protein